MLNVLNRNLLIFESLLINIKNNKYVMQTFNNTSHFFVSTNIVINWNKLYFVDLSNIVSNNLIKSTVFYTYFSKKTWQSSQFIFYNILYINSNSMNKLVFEWYERELYEKSNLLIKNMFDTRNLLYNYNNKILNNTNLIKNNYYWVYTDIYKKNITQNNNYRIIL